MVEAWATTVLFLAVWTLSSAKLDVPNSKGSIKPGCLSIHLNILVELVSPCLNSTSRASMTVLRLVLWTNQLISMELESVKYKPKYQVEEHHLLTSWDHNVYNVVLQFIFNFVLIIVYVFSGCCKSGFQIYHRIWSNYVDFCFLLIGNCTFNLSNIFCDYNHKHRSS